jgi:DNA-binding transcriptional LysR family regulator
LKTLKSLKGIASFVATVDSGSFTAAAKLQGVSAVAVSKNIATLERQLGARLFARTTRKLGLTVEGQNFYKQCQGPLRELEAAQAGVEQSGRAISGLVRITSASPFALGVIMPLIPAFHQANPKVQIELHLDDAVRDMVEQGYDVGIRVGPLRDDSRVARVIAPLPFVVCASPNYFIQHGMPTALEDLRKHNCLRRRSATRPDSAPWFLQGMTPQLDKQISGNFFANDFAALLAGAVQHQGIICTPLPLAMPLFRTGQLKPALTDFIDTRLDVYLHYPNRKNLPARTRCVVDYLLEKLRLDRDLQTPHQQLLAPFIESLAT